MAFRKEKLDDYIEDAIINESKENNIFDKIKASFNDFYLKYLSQNILIMFFDIYGLSNFIIHIGIVLFYISFMLFVTDTFRFSYFLTSFSIAVAVAVAISLGLITTQFPETMAPITRALEFSKKLVP